MFEFLKNLFKRKGAASRPLAGPSRGGTIKVFDEFGREAHIPREAWRTKILPDSIKAAWNDPNKLAGIVTGAFDDGFHAEVVGASKRLLQIDTDKQRGTSVYGFALMKAGKLDDAQRLFDGYLAEHPRDGFVMTNLAKVYAAKGQMSRAEEIIWDALRADPNQDNGLLWWRAIHNEREGEQGALKALRKVAAIPGSWRAQLWMARDALAANQKSEAMILYGQVMERAPRPLPADLLMQLSGDLGNAGCVKELVRLTRPHYSPEQHGIMAGNNLIKAYVELREFDEARAIVDQLYALKRPDFKNTLSFWETEIARARLESEPPGAPDGIGMLTLEGPVWMAPKTAAESLVEPKPSDEFVVAFLCATVDVPDSPKEVQRQLSDPPGRTSRALALFLAEQTHLQTRARAQVLVPWVASPGGFALFGARLSDEVAVKHGGPEAGRFGCIVAPHIHAHGDEWQIEVRVLRPSDGECLATLNQTLAIKGSLEELARLASSLLRVLREHAELTSREAPAFYRVPLGPMFPWYFFGLEQLLAVRCATMEPVNHDFLYGGRDILDRAIHLCLECPDNATTRLLLATLALRLKKVHPEGVRDCRDKVQALQKRKPLIGPVAEVVEKMLAEAESE